MISHPVSALFISASWLFKPNALLSYRGRPIVLVPRVAEEGLRGRLLSVLSIEPQPTLVPPFAQSPSRCAFTSSCDTVSAKQCAWETRVQ